MIGHRRQAAVASIGFTGSSPATRQKEDDGMANERRLVRGFRVRLLALVSVVFLAMSAAGSDDTPVRPTEKIIPDALLDECLKRGKSYAECGLSARRLLQGWIDKNYDPETKLIFRKTGNRRLCWDYHNVAADYYSSLVHVSNHVAPEYIQPGANLHETLLSSKKLCTQPNGIPGLYYFDTGKVESEATYLALSEWLRDGLIRIVENLGTDNIWYEEMCRLCDAMIRVGQERGGLYHQCSGSTETLGNMLQTLSRLYVMSGEKRYLEAAEEIGDALLLDPKIDTFRKMVERRDSFRDHGCEMIPGLAELFVVECKLGSKRAVSYREPLMKVLDQILETSAHPETGLFCGDLDENGNTVWLQPPDTWGYVLFSYENFDRATGTDRYRKAIEKPIRWLLDNRKNFEENKRARLWPHAAHRDTWSDSHESMIILTNRLGIFDKQVFEWLDWMTLQSEHRKHLDKQYGPYLNAHDDGSTGRCLCTHMMACSQGVRHEPFQEGLRIGGMPFGEGLVLSLESAKPYQGKLRFERPRCVYPTGTLDWARLNEMPAWFVVEPEKKYIVTLNGSQEMVMLGRELIDGVPISVEPGIIRTVWVQQVENQELPSMSLMPPGFLEQAQFPLHSLDPPVLLPDGREFKTWEQPARHTRTYYVARQHPKADDNNPGTQELPWKTISRAAATLAPGERVIVQEGVYRERIAPARGGDGPEAMITYEAAQGQKVVIRGSERFTGKWEPSIDAACGTAKGVWTAEIPKEVTDGVNPFALPNLAIEAAKAMPWATQLGTEPPYSLTQGLVYQNGQRMRQIADCKKVSDEAGTYCVSDKGRRLHIRPFNDIDPNKADFELTARVHAFAPREEGLAFIRFKGFIVEYVTGRFPMPQLGAVSAMRGHHCVFEDNLFRQINALALDFGHRQCFRLPRTFDMKPGGIGHVIRRNRFEDCGMCSMQGLGLIQGLVEDNVVVRSGWQRVRRLCESAGIKLHYCHHTLVRRNAALDTIDAAGIWIDHSNYNTRCTQNIISGCDLGKPWGAFFFEGSQYWNMVDHNIIWNCNSDGFYQHDCDRLIVANNLIGRCSGRPFRMQGGGGTRIIGGRVTSCKRSRIVGNIFYAAKAQPYVKDPDNVSDHNLFIDPPNAEPFALAKWQRNSGWDAHSSQTVASFEFDRNTWTLQQNPVVKRSLAPRQQAVTGDYFDTPTIGQTIPPGPFAEPNNKPIITLRQDPE